MSQSTDEREIAKSWVYLVDHGEAPDDYSPQIKVALAIYFGSVIAGDEVQIRDIAEVAGVSKDVLYHCIKGVRNKIRNILEGKSVVGLYISKL